jgi:hypothetical protein
MHGVRMLGIAGCASEALCASIITICPPPPAHLCSGDSTNVDEDPEVPAADSSDVRAAQPF